MNKEEMETPAQGELSDAQLDQVAGGKSAGGGVAIAISVISVGIGCVIMSIRLQEDISDNGMPIECAELYR